MVAVVGSQRLLSDHHGLLGWRAMCGGAAACSNTLVVVMVVVVVVVVCRSDHSLPSATV